MSENSFDKSPSITISIEEWGWSKLGTVAECQKLARYLW